MTDAIQPAHQTGRRNMECKAGPPKHRLRRSRAGGRRQGARDANDGEEQAEPTAHKVGRRGDSPSPAHTNGRQGRSHRTPAEPKEEGGAVSPPAPCLHQRNEAGTNLPEPGGDGKEYPGRSHPYTDKAGGGEWKPQRWGREGERQG